MDEKVGAVLVIGGGIAGIQASLDLADAGFKVYLLEETPSIGGTMAQLDKTFPTNDCSMCILAPKLVGAGRHPNIELLTYSEVKEVSGSIGNFKVKILKKTRYIDETKCTGCGICAENCPVEVPNEFDIKLGIRKAIYIPFPQSVPLKYAIDEEHCIKCHLCEKVCPAQAINHQQQPQEITLNIGAIIVATGFEEFDPHLKSEYGYGRFLNVISSVEFERILSASGPFGGKVTRPSDGKKPRKICFIQCVGSRDVQIGNNYCSAACCMYAIKEAVIAKEHAPGLECTVFYMDMRAHGKEFEQYYIRAKEEYNVRFVRSRVASVNEIPETKNLIVHYVEDEEPKTEEFDMVVLSVGMRPSKKAMELAKILGIELNKYGFCATRTFSPIETSKPGIYVCGAFASPKDIPESVAQASGAASKAMSIIATERGKLITSKEYPPERDISQEEPRIGVFICHCGINIGGIVNIQEVEEYIKTLPSVVYVENNLYTCSQDTQKRIREKIKEYGLNRVVVASCTPRTHEPLFRETIREAGLNQYLFEMANIRDQCSWVHMHEPQKATQKAKDLIRSVVAKARFLKPLPTPEIPVTPEALIIGGGVAGITAALTLANQGFKTHLIEKEKQLGGHLRSIYYLFENEDPQQKLREMVKEVMENPNIQVYLGAEVLDTRGYVGNFQTTIRHEGTEKTIKHGVIILATGAVEYKPTEYLYGEDPRVMTQHEFEEKLGKGEFKDFNARNVVMIQCVGARNEKNQNCARICCGQAVKNALKIKELNPETEIYVLYKDVRTFGFKEEYYREAAKHGVIFINYTDENKPQVEKVNGKLKVSFWEPVVKARIEMEADLLLLSAATIPNPENKFLAELFKVPLTKDGFFLEAHMKLRPVDFATEGVFVCGLAHSPKFIEESISQACAAAARASTILSKHSLEAEGTTAQVNEDLCSGCRICESLCEYGAIEMKENAGKLRATVLEAVCKSCGVCATACPTKAIQMGHFTNEQILAQVKAILKEEEQKV
jgi:heterodisulfide reductase subunit A